MSTATSYEKIFSEFFLNVIDTIRRHSKSVNSDGGDKTATYTKWSKEDQKLNADFLDTVRKVDVALCNNFDTRSALLALQSLIKDCNKSQQADVVLLKDIARYIWQLLAIFGVSFDEVPLESLSLVESKQKEDNQAAIKYVEALAEFRAEVRKFAKQGLTEDPQQAAKQILALCDTLRDQTLPDLGVRLEDKQVEGASYVVKVVGVEAIAQERALALKLKEEKLKQKQEQQKQKQQKQNASKAQKSAARSAKQTT